MSNYRSETFFIMLLLTSSIGFGALGSPVDSSITTSSLPSASEPIVRVEPANHTASVGSTFSVNVTISDVVDLYGLDIRLGWGPTVLSYVSKSVRIPVEDRPGGVLHKPVVPIKDTVDRTAGTYQVAYASLAPASSFNGSGTVVTITFKVLVEGECELYFLSTSLVDKAAALITHSVQEGYFYWPGKGRVPTADFTYSPDPAVINKTATFNAGASNDPDGAGIAKYIWDFGDGTKQNTTTPTTTHIYNQSGLGPWAFTARLSVVDNEGSQSRLKEKAVNAVHPRPVAKFTITPKNYAVLNKAVTFNGTDSYDPDPAGGITLYMWDFGDGTKQNTTTPTTTHTYANLGTYNPSLTVRDGEGFDSAREIMSLETTTIRDIEVRSVALYPAELPQGLEAAINATVANIGKVDESFRVTAYHNQTNIDPNNLTATEWTQIGHFNVTQMQKSITSYYLTNLPSEAGTINWKLNEAPMITAIPNNYTRVRAGTETGFWAITPGKVNVDAGSLSLIGGTPLVTGGWIWVGSLLNGTFTAGKWNVTLMLAATSANVKAIVWVRILKSNSSDPQASGARITALSNWTALFAAQSLSQSPMSFTGSIDLSSKTLSEEYLYVELQLEVVENTSGDAATEIGFYVYDDKAFISTPDYAHERPLTFRWDTRNARSGYYRVKVESTSFPHEERGDNNFRLSDTYITIYGPPVARFAYSPSAPVVGETISFNAAESYDIRGSIVRYQWDFGEGTRKTYVGTNLTYTTTHLYSLAGVYMVNLTVTDNDTLTHSAWKPISVEKAASTLDLTASPETIVWGVATTLSGTLSPPRSTTVGIYYREQGDLAWGMLQGASTDSQGEYSLLWTPPRAIIYQLKANWTGDANTHPVESSEVLLTVNRASSTISVNVNPTTVVVGSGIVVNGTISPRRVNVSIQYRLQGATEWATLAAVETTLNGYYAYTWPTSNTGTYEIRVRWLGDQNTLEAVSETKTVRIEAVPSNIFTYAIIAVVAVGIVVGVALYFLRIRKH